MVIGDYSVQSPVVYNICHFHSPVNPGLGGHGFLTIVIDYTASYVSLGHLLVMIAYITLQFFTAWLLH